MNSMMKWMLAAALAAGGLGLTAAPAKAAQVRFYVGAGSPYSVPPSPGPGYVWINGYYANGYWVPGRWAFEGGYGGNYGYYGNRYYGDRDDYYRRGDDDSYRDRGWYRRDDEGGWRRRGDDDHRDGWRGDGWRGDRRRGDDRH